MRDLDRAAVITGVIFVALGVVFLLDRLDVWTVRARFLWPAILIGLGVAIIARGFQRS